MILIREMAKQAFNQGISNQSLEKQVSQNPTSVVTMDNSYSGLQQAIKINQMKPKN